MAASLKPVRETAIPVSLAEQALDVGSDGVKGSELPVFQFWGAGSYLFYGRISTLFQKYYLQSFGEVTGTLTAFSSVFEDLHSDVRSIWAKRLDDVLALLRLSIGNGKRPPDQIQRIANGEETTYAVHFRDGSPFRPVKGLFALF
uniref:Uncharacterized protein n=1 Tax=Chromera velia CCMP2878 TaxID=1169474 RepID=A0A0G4H5E6_9ALVE|eukprot:Cvel_24692.t1-p1 / transcript=Cvel_24692.t1 / gene=Cvel_24692 / organism=Chromera_velia_CCMP2878 / gene_product=hypothetical protein / transcript_product=hypothetical protein / location=Cvel_scaffold2706:10065-10496(-) / protein_length=144 / sequence_SO=supercontig / SO=protein_coding / is_pseudo=false